MRGARTYLITACVAVSLIVYGNIRSLNNITDSNPSPPLHHHTSMPTNSPTIQLPTELPTTEPPTSASTEPTASQPTTEPPTAEPPTTKAPTTEAPTTEPPTPEPTSEEVAVEYRGYRVDVRRDFPKLSSTTQYIQCSNTSEYEVLCNVLLWFQCSLNNDTLSLDSFLKSVDDQVHSDMHYLMNQTVSGEWRSKSCFERDAYPHYAIRVLRELNSTVHCDVDLLDVNLPSNSDSMFDYYLEKLDSYWQHNAYKVRPKDTPDVPTSEARIAYFIMAKKGQVTLAMELIELLFHPAHIFMVHLDTDDRAEFDEIKAMPFVYVLERSFIGVRSGISLTYIELASIAQLLSLHLAWDFWINLSANDVPVTSNKDLVAFLTQNKGKNLMDVKPCLWTPEYTMVHTECIEDKIAFFLENTPQGVSDPNFTRSAPQWYFGSQWMVLSRDFAEYLVGSPSNLEILRFGKHVWIPDEKVIHTLFMNSSYTDTLIDSNYRYINWNASSPTGINLNFNDTAILKESYEMRESGFKYFFARKMVYEDVKSDYMKWFRTIQPPVDWHI